MTEDRYRAEAEARWGHTDAYQQSAARTARYTDDDWAMIKAEAAEITTAFTRLLRDGATASGAEPRRLAELHREHITRWFYDCPPRMHAALGAMYVTDARFGAGIDGSQPGLARFMADAFAANASSA